MQYLGLTATLQQARPEMYVPVVQTLILPIIHRICLPGQDSQSLLYHGRLADGPVPLCSSNSISLSFVSLIHGHHATLIVTRRLGVHATQGHEKFASGGMLGCTTGKKAVFCPLLMG